MKNILANWKTTSAGIMSIVAGIVLFTNNRAAVTESLASILAGIGLIFASDYNSNNQAKPSS